MRQITLASQGSVERYGKKTWREKFLEEMDQIMPWAQLELLIEPNYPKEGNGRPPVGLKIMPRIYFLQHWFNLSGPAAEEASPLPQHEPGCPGLGAISFCAWPAWPEKSIRPGVAQG